MLRIRSIHYDAFKSNKIAQLSAEAERCWWRIQCLCDDDGRAEDDLELICGMLFPKRRDFHPEDIDEWMTELADAGLITRYTTDGSRYFAVLRWHDYQHPRRPNTSKLPPATGQSTTTTDNDGQRRTSGGNDIEDVDSRDRRDDDGHVVQEGRGVGEGGEREQEGSLRGEAAPTTQASPKAAAERNRIVTEATELALVLLGRRDQAQGKSNPAGWLRSTRDGIRADLIAAGAFDLIDNGAGAVDLAALVAPAPTGASSPVDSTTAARAVLMERNRRRAEGTYDCERCKDDGVYATDNGFVSCDHTLEAAS